MSDPIGQHRETTDGKVWARLGIQVEVGLCNGEVLERSVELNGTRRFLEGTRKRGE